MFSATVGLHSASEPPMQKPTTPISWLVTESRPDRYVAAPATSFAAWSIARPIISRIASSGSPVVSPWKKSGASVVNPADAKRSATSLMCPTRPHHSCTRMSPGPPPSASARYPSAVPPLLAKVAIDPMAHTLGRVATVRRAEPRAGSGDGQERLRVGGHGAGVAAADDDGQHAPTHPDDDRAVLVRRPGTHRAPAPRLLLQRHAAAGDRAREP